MSRTNKIFELTNKIIRNATWLTYIEIASGTFACIGGLAALSNYQTTIDDIYLEENKKKEKIHDRYKY